MKNAIDNLKTLTPAEAAVVANVSLRDVNRTVDEKILPEGCYSGSERTRRFKADACLLIAFYFQAAHLLTSEERIRMIAKASRHLQKYFKNAKKEWIVRDDFLSIDLKPFLTGVRERLTKLAKARARVVEDPEILSGTPVIKGTRVPVYDIAACVSAGDTKARILDGYPTITGEDVDLAVLYARANPLRGRPPKSLLLPKGAVIVSHRRIPWRKQAS
ncbi:MAG TPA: DUF433 domain-containing protein [Candidatus Angelobacter sp.]|nr:DUF433 domain-containing protein [Candidatus Angelobacter sp.]